MVQGNWYRWLLGLTLCAVVLTPPTLGRCFGPPRESSGMIPFIDTQAMRDYATYLRDPTEGLHINTWLYSEVLIKTIRGVALLDANHFIKGGSLR